MSNVTIDIRTEYWSWDNYPYTWNEATRSWDEAYDRFYTLNVDEVVKAVDGSKKLLRLPCKEVVKTASLFNKNVEFSRFANESAKITESRKKSISARRRDSFRFADSVNKDFQKVHKQSLKLSETKRKFSFHRGFDEKFGLSTTYWDNISFYISNSENFTISERESHKSVFDKTMDDYLWITETLGRKLATKLRDEIFLKDNPVKSASYKRGASETFGISEYSNRKFGLRINDIIDAGENFEQPKLAKGFYEKVNFNEGFFWKVLARHQEAFGAASEFTKNVQYNRTPQETLEFSEALNKSLVFLKTDKFLAEEKLLKDVFIESLETLVSTDGYDKRVMTTYSDVVDFVDSVKKTMGFKLFDEFGIRSDYRNYINIHKLEEASVFDKRTGKIRQVISDGMEILDLDKNNIKHFVAEDVVDVTDGFDRVVNFFVKAYDSVIMKDKTNQDFKIKLDDGFVTEDDYTKKALYSRLVPEKFTVSETYWDNILFYLGVLESCVLQDKVDKGYYKPIRGEFKIIDLPSNHAKPVLTEQPLKLSESFKKVVGFNRLLVESIVAVDKKLGSQMVKAPKERLSYKDLLIKVVERGFEYENLGLEDAVKSSIHFLRSSEESFGVTDVKLGSEINKQSSEELSLVDIIGRIFHLPVRELLTCDDELGRQVIFTTVIKEALNTVDAASKSANHKISERAVISERLRKKLRQFSRESFLFMDELIREFIARRLLGEAVTVEDYIAKGVSCLMSEEMNTYDALIKACDGILSNISIKEGELTLEEFLDLVDRPPNYTKFIEFKVGEYEYEDALVRITMKTKVKQVQPVASNAVMHVDIPDTDDRGDVEITDVTAPTKVYFNKFYYNPPEVNVTLKVGNTADGVLTPNVVTTEGKDDRGRYFEVELWDENWANRKTGRISWVSKGY